VNLGFKRLNILMNISERVGHLLGFPLGGAVFIISFIRNSRMFHPRGAVATLKIQNLNKEFLEFPADAMGRFSNALWKNKEWRDVLGIAIRFDSKQDLLFASFERPWQTPFGPFLTKYHDFFQNDFYAVSPFRYKEKDVYFKLAPYIFIEINGERTEKLKKNIEAHSVFRLYYRENHQDWNELADIKLGSEIAIDQNELMFNPFLVGLNIHPKGFIHHLRIGVYRLGQLGRSIR
jgi:hypothetical protein